MTDVVVGTAVFNVLASFVLQYAPIFLILPVKLLSALASLQKGWTVEGGYKNTAQLHYVAKFCEC